MATGTKRKHSTERERGYFTFWTELLLWDVSQFCRLQSLVPSTSRRAKHKLKNAIKLGFGWFHAFVLLMSYLKGFFINAGSAPTSVEKVKRRTKLGCWFADFMHFKLMLFHIYKSAEVNTEVIHPEDHEDEHTLSIHRQWNNQTLRLDQQYAFSTQNYCFRSYCYTEQHRHVPYFTKFGIIDYWISN